MHIIENTQVSIELFILVALDSQTFPAHRCGKAGCGSVLVLDGNMKNRRDICAADCAGFIEYAGLPGKVKTGCMDTPERG